MVKQHHPDGVHDDDDQPERSVDSREGNTATTKEDKNDEKHKDASSVAPFVSDGKYRNKQRCLVLCLRGATARYRHLLEDIRTLLPHHKKESKLDPGKGGMAAAVNDIAEMRSCNTVVFLECRKRQDAYLWVGNVGKTRGPSAKFHLTNVHTMDELRLTGNCMKGSRPILSFDEAFDRLGHLKLLKEMFTDVFGTPRGHPKSKPFVDRVMAFYYADQKIWVRNYQILEQQPTNAKEASKLKKELGQEESTSLVEIGPRFVLNPIRIFRGSFGGQTLYVNPDFVSPNDIRALEKKRKGMSYEQRKEAQKKRKTRQDNLVLPEDPLDTVFR
ncbi:Brix domain containing protein [Nitzschia inconspicua]|uniref:Brix domain containing protein n=1 Tax=Nitzschia inconspicua TaxID=303405 RepID=A0A9K3KQB4_9STRA|nr:Brix domain containing protein [Nitzschia inconspicua]